MRKIYYDIKPTQANTDYLQLSQHDSDSITCEIYSILCYMNELQLSQDKDIKEFTNWFKKPNRNYPYNKKLKKHNSPQSMLAGMLNNIQFGNQQDYSLQQLEYIINILNICIDIIDEIKLTHNINLQTNQTHTKIWLQENLWITS
jgi:hypothetical protein